ncbi:hypothetical protein GCM10018966_064160 [Streptomyces yanii]
MEVQTGAGETAVNDVGPVLQHLELALDQGPHAFLRVQVRRVGGQLEHGEPVGVRGDEFA